MTGETEAVEVGCGCGFAGGIREAAMEKGRGWDVTEFFLV